MPSDFTTRPEIRGTFGAVATTHWIASAVAMSVLERGGNAFDAAVTAGFVVPSTQPPLNRAGGGGARLLKGHFPRAPGGGCGRGRRSAAAARGKIAGLWCR